MTKFGDTHEYAMWDAAYVLGSLSSSDRREYEEHLSTCQQCRDAVSELCGMPALLSRLDRDEVRAIDEGDVDATPPPPQMLGTLLAKVSWRRRRSRMVTWTLATVAAAVLVIGVFVSFSATTQTQTHTPTSQAEAAPLTMMRVKPSAISSTVTLTDHSWGTRIEMNCIYQVSPEVSDASDDDEAGDKLAMVVVGRDGSQTQLATWVALTGVPATPGGSTSMPLREIAAVQIVSADSGEVLLQRSL
jgi:hypothetical protein